MKRFCTLILAAWMVLLSSEVSAQQAPGRSAPAPSLPTAQPASPVTFPYVAEIIGDDVYIRSGPGTNYYRCSKLNSSEQVTVVAQEYSWSRILPPPECFSWISTELVQPDSNNPAVGIVRGQAVRVWAGSPYLEPMQSSALQTRLNTGDTVRLLGEQRANYYKIAPPPGAYFYVSTEYTRYIGSVEQIRAQQPGGPAGAEKPTEATVVPTTVTPETIGLRQYYELIGKIELERKKPLGEQDYTEIKNQLSAIANNPQAGKAARYAELQLKLLERFELAKQSVQDLQSQDVKLAETRGRIKAQARAKLEKLLDLGKYAAIGYLKPSLIYTGEFGKIRYLLADNTGKVICYAEPQATAAGVDLTGLLDRKIGLVGKIEPDPHTAAALIRFENVVKLE